MRALISAGGFGTRIRSVSSDIPKPLIKVNGIPVLERAIIQLKKYGITDIRMFYENDIDFLKQW